MLGAGRAGHDRDSRLHSAQSEGHHWNFLGWPSVYQANTGGEWNRTRYF